MLLLQKVQEADMIVFLPPNKEVKGRGCHVELGLALANNKKVIYVLEEEEAPNNECLFYSLCMKVTMSNLPQFLNKWG